MQMLNRPEAILATLMGLVGLACGGGDKLEPTPEATTIAVNGGNNQSAATGASVTAPPSVKVTDAAATPVSGVDVSFAVAAGGGSLTGASQSTDAFGIATVGSWTLGPTPGTNTLTATSEGLIGSPVTFTATGEAPDLVFLVLAAGDFHTCGLASSGAAYCWGLNDEGQLGTGSSASISPVPVGVAGGQTFNTIAIGYEHSCGVTSSGEAYCWGLNESGQLGDGTGTSSTTPVAVAGALGFETVAPANGIGSPYTCGLTVSGTAYCWGASGVGGLGNGSAASQSAVPSPVSGDHVFSALDVNGHGCGLTSSGAAYCWGLNSEGQLGSGTMEFVIPAPTPVSGSLSFSVIAVGGLHTCGLTGSGVYCWGLNSDGQLGNGLLSNSSVPVAITGGQSFSTIAAGGFSTCGLTVLGAAYCWGNNDHGQLGNGSTASSSTPVEVSGGLSFSALALGSSYACGVTTSGAAYCWGRNDTGQLGIGTIDGPEMCAFACSTIPVPVTGGPPLQPGVSKGPDDPAFEPAPFPLTGAAPPADRRTAVRSWRP